MCSECEGDACVRERECGRCVIYFGERDPLVRFFLNFPLPFYLPLLEPTIGKILRKFESDSIKRLHGAMITSRSLVNPAESDSAWEAYRRWINSKISKLK